MGNKILLIFLILLGFLIGSQVYGYIEPLISVSGKSHILLKALTGLVGGVIAYKIAKTYLR